MPSTSNEGVAKLGMENKFLMESEPLMKAEEKAVKISGRPSRNHVGVLRYMGGHTRYFRFGLALQDSANRRKNSVKTGSTLGPGIDPFSSGLSARKLVTQEMMQTVDELRMANRL